MSEDLFLKARSAMKKCHAPYSNFPVGAALRTEDGRIYSGCNIEVVSFPEGWCAETTAIAHMVMDGGGKIAESRSSPSGCAPARLAGAVASASRSSPAPRRACSCATPLRAWWKPC